MRTIQEQQNRVTFLCQRLKGLGHRMTPQRRMILDALCRQNHPTAEEIYLEVIAVTPSTSLATIYKTLETLKEIGEVGELEVGDGKRHYDGFPEAAHSHAVCRRCGKIDDLNLNVESLVTDSKSLNGFTVDLVRVELFGLCQACRAKLQ